jgi:hypothetical protein
MKRHLYSGLLVLAVVLGFTANLQAAPVTVEITGTVSLGNAEVGISVGDVFNLNYTVESTTPASPYIPNVSIYYNAITAMSLTVGSVSYSTLSMDPSYNNIRIFNDYGPGYDNYRVDALFLDGPKPATATSASLQMTLVNIAGTEFGDQSLVTDPAILSALNDGQDLKLLYINGIGSGAGVATVRFDISQIQLASPVPEPSAPLLLGLGILGLMLMRRHKRIQLD